jgi:hypothetical protein
MGNSRVTPQGQAMGKSAARLSELGRKRLKAAGLTDMGLDTLRDDMCKTCACRPGVVPNGCLQTQLDLLKAAAEGKPFMCHAPKDGRICAGWAGLRAELVANPLPPQIATLLAKHEFSPHDDERHNVRAETGLTAQGET